MHRLPTQRMYVLIENLIEMNKRTLTRAVAPMLQGRQGNGFVIHVRLYGTVMALRRLVRLPPIR